MAKQNDPKFQAAKFEEVVQCTLTPEEGKAVLGYLTDAEGVLELTEVLMSQGYEVSFRFDPIRGNYSVCLKGAYASCNNAGCWLYGNGNTLTLAISSAFYKHFEIYQQGKWASRSADTQLGVS